MGHSLRHRGWHWVLTACIWILCLLHVLRVSNLLLFGRCHAVVRRKAAATGHVGGLCWELGMAVDVFRRVNAGRFAVYAIFIARCRLGGVEAGLEWSDGSTRV